MLRLIVAMLLYCPGEPIIAVQGCRALLMLSKSAKNLSHAAAEGAIQAVATCISIHKEDPSVLSFCFTALKRFSCDVAHHEMLKKAKASQLVFEYVIQGNPDTQKNAIEALADIPFDASFVPSEVLFNLVEVLDRCKLSSEEAAYCLHLLWRIVQDVQHLLNVTRTPICCIISFLLKTHKNDNFLFVKAFGLLGELCAYKETHANVRYSKCVEMVTSVLTEQSHNAAVAIEGLAVLHNFACNKMQVSMLTSYGSIDMVLSEMALFPDNEELQEMAFSALSLIIPGASEKKRFVVCGGRYMLLKILRAPRNNELFKQKVRELLYRLPFW